MTVLHRNGISGFIISLVFTAIVTAQTQSFPFVVIKNQKAEIAPKEIVLIKDKQRFQVSIVNGILTMPSDLAAAKSLEMITSIDGETIDVTNVRPYGHTYRWKLLLANHDYGLDYQFVARQRWSWLTRWYKIRRSCIFSVEPSDGEGTFQIEEPCRFPARSS